MLIYTVISKRVEIGKTRNCVEARRPEGGVLSPNFEFSQFPRVLIGLYSISTRGKNVLYFLEYSTKKYEVQNYAIEFKEPREIFRVDIKLYQHGSA